MKKKQMKLLTEGNSKIIKGEKKGYKTFIVHLAPYNLSGRNVCPWASKGCASACLNTAGRGGISKGSIKMTNGLPDNNIQKARLARTDMFFNNRRDFMKQLIHEIGLAIVRSEKKGLIPVFRLNGTSDLSWEKWGIIQFFPDYQFYDYTKSTDRMISYLSNDMPKNYHLTFSMSETNRYESERILSEGGNVAMVFSELPDTYMGYKVVNGDDTDLRFLDPYNVIIGLKAKGKAKKDATGFVIQPAMVTV